MYHNAHPADCGSRLSLSRYQLCDCSSLSGGGQLAGGGHSRASARRLMFSISSFASSRVPATSSSRAVRTRSGYSLDMTVAPWLRDGRLASCMGTWDVADTAGAAFAGPEEREELDSHRRGADSSKCRSISDLIVALVS